MAFRKTFRHISRYREVARILAKYELYRLVERLDLSRLIPKIPHAEKAEKPLPATVRMIIEELGPTYIKLGQILSTRPDLIPHDYLCELEKLQDTAPSVPFSKVSEIIEKEFGKPYNQVFTHFEEEPLAAASLGQVHRATLPDGNHVVVKVQRPGITQVIETDLEILFDFARILEARSERARIYALTDLVEEFSLTLRNELDYTREGRNADRLRKNLAELPGSRVPLVYWDYTTPRVITMEEMRGVKITDFPGLSVIKANLPKVADNLAQSVLQQIFVDGFFHGDPHPGNLIVLPGDFVAFIDCGMMGRLDRETRASVVNLLSTFLSQDSKKFAEEILNIGTAPPNLNRRVFIQDIDRALRQYYDMPTGEMHLGELLKLSLDITINHKIVLPSNFAMLVKVFITVEGVTRQLDPSYNFTEAARPFLTRALKKEFSWEESSTELFRTLTEIRTLAISLPSRISTLLDKAVDGTFSIEFKHMGLKDVSNKFDKAVNRLSFSLLVSALIVGSSIVIQSQVGPRIHGYPFIGVAGFLIAGFFCLWLLISFIRAGRLW